MAENTSAPDRLVIPVFPLSGSLLLPGTFLPLNVFEQRYRQMVRDVLNGDRRIGMIQPRSPLPGDWAPLAAERPDPRPAPQLYPVGCLGEIEDCEPQTDGRYLIVLKGIARFRVRHELPRRRVYRRVLADLAEFSDDAREPESSLDPGRLLAAVRHVQEAGRIGFDLELLRALPGVMLLNGLCVALPLSPAEKQALLEARTPGEREDLLLTLMGMGLEPLDAAEIGAPPLVN